MRGSRIEDQHDDPAKGQDDAQNSRSVDLFAEKENGHDQRKWHAELARNCQCADIVRDRERQVDENVE